MPNDAAFGKSVCQKTRRREQQVAGLAIRARIDREELTLRNLGPATPA